MFMERGVKLAETVSNGFGTQVPALHVAVLLQSCWE